MDAEYVKVRVSNGDGNVETLWAIRVGDGNLFRLDNAPYFAYGISEGDVIEGEPVADGMFDFLRVEERSGNRTVRVIHRSQPRADDAVLAGLLEIGCLVEGGPGQLVSVTVPPSVDLNVVAEYLTQTGIQWEYADPTWEDLFG
jgi:hypothetical protein